MSEKKESIKGTLEWHYEQLNKIGVSDKYAFVWLTGEFFWDKQLNRPKGYLFHEAHLYATLAILDGVTDFVFVQDCQDYYDIYYGRKKKL